MRVTKRIEEYIYRTLSNKAQEKISAMWEPVQEEEAELRKQIEAIVAKANAEAEALLADNGRFHLHYNRYHNGVIELVGCINRKPGAFREEDTITDNLRKKAKDEAERICLELEMGGTKADLEAMMSAITF